MSYRIYQKNFKFEHDFFRLLVHFLCMERPHAHVFIVCFDRNWAHRWHLNFFWLVEEAASIVLLIPDSAVFSKDVYEDSSDPEKVGSGYIGSSLQLNLELALGSSWELSLELVLGPPELKLLILESVRAGAKLVV